jgi:hypothetical protein
MKLCRAWFSVALVAAFAPAYAQVGSTSKRFEVRRPDHLSPSVTTLTSAITKAKLVAHNYGWTGTFQVADPQQPVTIALAWMDPPGPVMTSNSTRNRMWLYVDFACPFRYTGNKIGENDFSESRGCHPRPSCPCPAPDVNNVQLVVVPLEAYVGGTQFQVVVAPNDLQAKADTSLQSNNQDAALFLINATRVN